MKKKILIPVGMAALFLCASWQEAETTGNPCLSQTGQVVNSLKCRPTDRK